MLKKIVLSIFLIGYFHQYETCIQVSEPPISTTTPPTTVPKLKEDSVILTSEEKANLQNITGYNGNLTLLYRATRDGFAAKTFHSKSSNKENTITIIKSTLNYVFGGYTSALWNNEGFSTDSKAYLFSLRVNGTPTALKYPVILPSVAICNYLFSDGPIFGDGFDIYVSDYSNLNELSYTYCHSYQCPNGVTRYSPHSKLAGSYKFKVSEIEVFHMSLK